MRAAGGSTLREFPVSVTPLLRCSIIAVASANWLNPIIRSADELVDVLRLPVIGVVPRQVLAA